MASAQQPAILSEAPLTGRPVEFHAVVHPDTVYVGQQANYQVGVFLGDDVRARLRRNPEFVPPEVAGVLGYDLPVAHVMLPDSRGGRYEAHVFERAIFPLAAGVLEIPSARLSYSLPLTRSFFSREESFVLRTEPVRLVALPPPEAGRPPDFSGAVGSGLELRLTVDSAGARVGDPLLVTASITGAGNVNLFPRPTLEVRWGRMVDAGERVELDTTARTIGGRKEFDWLVTPDRAGYHELRAVSYSYFDPALVEYRAAPAAAESVRVADGVIVALDSAVGGRVPMSVRERYRGAAPEPPAGSPFYWLAVALLPLPALAVRVRRLPRRAPPPPTAAQRLAVLVGGHDATFGSGADPVSDARRLRALMLRVISDRLAMGELPVSDGPPLVRLLRLEGVSTGTARQVARLMSELDRAAFSGGAPRTASRSGPSDLPAADHGPGVLADGDGSGAPRVATATTATTRELVDRVRDLVAAVDAEARNPAPVPPAGARARRRWRDRRDADRRQGDGRHPGAPPSPVIWIVAGTLLTAAAAAGGTGAAHAAEVPTAAVASVTRQVGPRPQPVVGQADDDRDGEARAAFNNGVSLYREGRFAAARDSFTSAARLVPRSADSWANSGTAAWAAGDTTGAALGWQRALRLQPGSEDVRQRLRLLPGGQLTGGAGIPPIPAATLQWVALAAWASGWALALWNVAGGGTLLTGAVGALLLLATAGGSGSALLVERAAARELYVASPGAMLRAQPALTGTPRRALAAGEVVQVRARAGVWSRVSAGGETGWVERSQLRELRAD